MARALIVMALEPACAGKTYVVSDAEPLSTAEMVSALKSGLDSSALSLPVPRLVWNGMRALGIGARALDSLVGDLAVNPKTLADDTSWRPVATKAETLAGLTAMAAHWRSQNGANLSPMFGVPGLWIGVIGGLALLSSAILVAVVRAYARSQLMDIPNERSSHAQPTPRGGGLGIIVALLLSWLVGVWLSTGELPWRVVGLSSCVAVMAALGWIDDHRSLSSRFRFAIQALIIGWAIWLVGLPEPCVLFGFDLPLIGWALLPLAVVSSLWLVNLFNFMDGIDGIAGTQAIIGSLGLVLLIGEVDPTISIGLWATIGACAGFCYGTGRRRKYLWVMLVVPALA